MLALGTMVMHRSKETAMADASLNYYITMLGKILKDFPIGLQQMRTNITGFNTHSSGTARDNASKG